MNRVMREMFEEARADLVRELSATGGEPGRDGALPSAPGHAVPSGSVEQTIENILRAP